MRSDIRDGETFPDYELADQSGRRRSLSELQGANPMVLHLSRGGFDPKEHQFVGQLVEVYPEFRNAYTRLALISTDNQLNINAVSYTHLDVYKRQPSTRSTALA